MESQERVRLGKDEEMERLGWGEDEVLLLAPELATRLLIHQNPGRKPMFSIITSATITINCLQFL
jgi:hypothetical protein